MFNRKKVKFNGVMYRLNLLKLKEVCLTTSSDCKTKEIQIAQTYEIDDSGELELQTKVEHETKSPDNQQNDMIIYDIVKLLIISLLENNSTELEFETTFGLELAINTLLSWGILEEIK